MVKAIVKTLIRRVKFYFLFRENLPLAERGLSEITLEMHL
jgi:hypothetical protein